MVDIVPLRAAPKDRVPEIRNAYRFLTGTHASVNGLFDAVQTLSTARRAANATNVGRMKSDEMDVLRSAIVLTSSGLDASMKRLVLDAGKFLINVPGSSARKHFEQGIKEMLAAKTIDQPLKDAIVSVNPAESILRYYLSTKTKASMQGSGDLKSRVRAVLGIPATRITDGQLDGLDNFFLARNRIAHSMDYVNLTESKSRARRNRSSDEVATLCNTAFKVATDFMHAAAELLVANRGR
ncbi:hypothetical protein [Agromyces seonyuensis]|uniref:RiboL-PSP-HEPN domain-containing protein n=1 Tax=Agromyces seonyuensis TaxID=2662446 RepID=A0A6I4NXJ6_9MICO|nr:hypothetical protein [Agromyces seonyuensis]MWB99070.1 hypothetical protein [Agromyces seonyuensis]